MFPRSGVQIRVYVCTGDAIFALWTSTWNNDLDFALMILFVCGGFCHLNGTCSSVLVSRLMPGWALPCLLAKWWSHLQVGLGYPGCCKDGRSYAPCYTVVPLVPDVDLLLTRKTKGSVLFMDLLYVWPIYSSWRHHAGICARGILPSAASERRCMSRARQCDRQVQGPALGAYIVFLSHYPWVYRWTCRSPPNPTP